MRVSSCANLLTPYVSTSRVLHRRGNTAQGTVNPGRPAQAGALPPEGAYLDGMTQFSETDSHTVSQSPDCMR